MRELVIYTVLVSVMFGLPAYLFTLVLKYCPVKPEKATPLPVMAGREVIDSIPDADSRRAVLARLLEIQAVAGGEIGRVRHIRTLEDHRTTLRNALERAASRVVIVSPFLSAGAVKADKIDMLVRSAVGRGVEVLVFIDRALNMGDDGTENQASIEGRTLLEDAGAMVFNVDRIHNKTLCVDDSVIIEGSFNWLSALRNKNHAHQRQENSIMVTGGDAGRMIADELKALTRLAA